MHFSSYSMPAQRFWLSLNESYGRGFAASSQRPEFRCQGHLGHTLPDFPPAVSRSMACRMFVSPEDEHAMPGWLSTTFASCASSTTTCFELFEQSIAHRPTCLTPPPPNPLPQGEGKFHAFAPPSSMLPDRNNLLGEIRRMARTSGAVGGLAARVAGARVSASRPTAPHTRRTCARSLAAWKVRS